MCPTGLYKVQSERGEKYLTHVPMQRVEKLLTISADRDAQENPIISLISLSTKSHLLQKDKFEISTLLLILILPKDLGYHLEPKSRQDNKTARQMHFQLSQEKKLTLSFIVVRGKHPPTI